MIPANGGEADQELVEKLAQHLEGKPSALAKT